MPHLTARDVHSTQDQTALTALTHRPGLLASYTAEVADERVVPGLTYEPSTGWWYVDCCAICGDDVGYQLEPVLLDELCGSCHDVEFAAVTAGRHVAA